MELRLGYADESSGSSYLGVHVDDAVSQPFQRYDAANWTGCAGNTCGVAFGIGFVSDRVSRWSPRSTITAFTEIGTRWRTFGGDPVYKT